MMINNDVRTRLQLTARGSAMLREVSSIARELAWIDLAQSCLELSLKWRERWAKETGEIRRGSNGTVGAAARSADRRD